MTTSKVHKLLSKDKTRRARNLPCHTRSPGRMCQCVFTIYHIHLSSFHPSPCPIIENWSSRDTGLGEAHHVIICKLLFCLDLPL